MKKKDIVPEKYSRWLSELKQRIRNSQQKAILAVNTELIKLYWQIGNDILTRQKNEGWGSKVIERLSKDLKSEFPAIKGFSRANMMYMRSFAEAWPDFEENPIVQQAVGQIPWSHNLALLGKLKDRDKRLAYTQRIQENGWSRNVLIHQIENKLLERQGNSSNNFKTFLPPAQSELAQETLKDPYIFDFLALAAEAKERDLEIALTENISQFLLELGSGFAYVGKQVHLEVGGDDFFLDLLFYHLKLHCYVVIELKTCEFKPEHLGQLNFYLTIVDDMIKTDLDQRSIGLLLCKSRNKIVAEYALRENGKPVSVAEYKLRESLPSIEEIQKQLQEDLLKETKKKKKLNK
ncbi:MAG: DUF1016 domain-containing protein [Lentisphaeraceae bacterium]|nr:DUF1016 domain-containing protein [Lentisphaeraceae bacterium]